jgi:hypothetical protein
MNKEQIIQRSQFRAAQIAGSAARIERKLKDLPNDQRAPGWRKRLDEYALSMECINLTLKTGNMIYVSGAKPNATDTVVSPPAAGMKLEGK